MINKNIIMTGDWHIQMENPSSRIDDYKLALESKTDQLLNACLRLNADLVMPGDMFSKVQTDNEFIIYNLKLLKKFKENDVKVIAVFGNHDVYRTQAELEDKTPLKILEEAGLVKILRRGDTIEYNNLKIYGFGYYDELTPALKEDNGIKHMAIIHKFYQQSQYKEFNIQYNKLEELGYDFALCGHDHIAYETDIRPYCTVFRPGALMRGTVHDYNFTRGVFFVYLNTENFKSEMVQLNVRPMSEVMAETKVIEKIEKQEMDFKEYTKSMENVINKEKDYNNLTEIEKRILNKDGYTNESKNLLIEIIKD